MPPLPDTLPGGAGGPAEGSEPGAVPARLSARGLVVRRGSRPVLDGLSFDVRPGEVFGLLGPNGAGKTTVFEVLLGLVPPESGELWLDGRPIAPGHSRLRQLAGVVFQEPALDPRLTLRENLRLAASMYGASAGAARRRADEQLERAGLSARSGEPVAWLSGGLRRRADLARALVHEPALLILDEPSAGLDEAAFRGFWADLLEQRHRRGLTLLLTTHRAEEAEHCDRLAFLDHGRVAACDSPARLRERVRGDLLLLEATDPQAVAARLASRLGIELRLLDQRLALHCERAAELIPRIVESLPAGSLKSVNLRRTGLGEVFLHLTGHDLEPGARAAAPGADP